MEVRLIPPQEMDRSQIEPFLDDAIALSRTTALSAQYLYNMCHCKQYLLIGFFEGDKLEGAAVVKMNNLPLETIAFVMAIGGKGLAKTFNDFTALLAKEGATRIQGYARPSVTRLWRTLGFTSDISVVDYEIRQETPQ
jgi:hypothetical protein